ncbi:hypothetical protein KPATCC21470_8150 [Kitasatospora purpeofusca]
MPAAAHVRDEPGPRDPPPRSWAGRTRSSGGPVRVKALLNGAPAAAWPVAALDDRTGG